MKSKLFVYLGGDAALYPLASGKYIKFRRKNGRWRCAGCDNARRGYVPTIGISNNLFDVNPLTLRHSCNCVGEIIPPEKLSAHHG